jgi:hypothetical protein
MSLGAQSTCFAFEGVQWNARTAVTAVASRARGLDTWFHRAAGSGLFFGSVHGRQFVGLSMQMLFVAGASCVDVWRPAFVMSVLLA